MAPKTGFWCVGEGAAGLPLPWSQGGCYSPWLLHWATVFSAWVLSPVWLIYYYDTKNTFESIYLGGHFFKLCLPYGRPRFDPWVRKILWRRQRLPTPVFWPGEFHRLYCPQGRRESDLTEQLSLSMNPIQYKNIIKNKAFSVQEDNLILKYVSVGIRLDK